MLNKEDLETSAPWWKCHLDTETERKSVLFNWLNLVTHTHKHTVLEGRCPADFIYNPN